MTVAELRKEIVALGGDPKGKKPDLEETLEGLRQLRALGDSEIPTVHVLVTVGDIYCWDNGGTPACVSEQGHRIAADGAGPVLGYMGRDGDFIQVTESSLVHRVDPGDDGLEAALGAV